MKKQTTKARMTTTIDLLGLREEVDEEASRIGYNVSQIFRTLWLVGKEHRLISEVEKRLKSAGVPAKTGPGDQSTWTQLMLS